MREEQLLAPYWFRFTEPDDMEKYGKDWYLYDETALIRLPARVLVAYEQALDVPIPEIMNGMRQGSILGNWGATWIALRQAGRDVKLDDYSPVVALVEWTTGDPHANQALDSGKDSPDPGPGPVVELDVSPLAESPRESTR